MSPSLSGKDTAVKVCGCCGVLRLFLCIFSVLGCGGPEDVPKPSVLGAGQREHRGIPIPDNQCKLMWKVIPGTDTSICRYLEM